MATSSYPSWKAREPLTQLMAHASLKTAQVAAMITPPIYLVTSLVIRRGKPFSVRQFMRTSTSWTVVGAGLGALMGYGRLRNEPDYALEDRVYRLVRQANDESSPLMHVGAQRWADKSRRLLPHRRRSLCPNRPGALPPKSTLSLSRPRRSEHRARRGDVGAYRQDVVWRAEGQARGNGRCPRCHG
jgi:hypothetical protein